MTDLMGVILLMEEMPGGVCSQVARVQGRTETMPSTHEVCYGNADIMSIDHHAMVSLGELLCLVG